MSDRRGHFESPFLALDGANNMLKNMVLQQEEELTATAGRLVADLLQSATSEQMFWKDGNVTTEAQRLKQEMPESEPCSAAVIRQVASFALRRKNQILNLSKQIFEAGGADQSAALDHMLTQLGIKRQALGYNG